MKKIFFLAMTAFLAASCSFKIYETSALDSHYEANMKSPEEMLVKESVKIFTEENQVPSSFVVLDYITYTPMLPFKSIMLKKFYAKVAVKANELGGNGVLITGAGMARIISYGGEKAFNIAEAFADRSVDTFSKSRRNLYISQFNRSIDTKSKTAENIDAVNNVRNDIAIYDAYFVGNKAAMKLSSVYKCNVNYREAELKADGDLSKLNKSQKSKYIKEYCKSLEEKLKSIKSLEDVTALRHMVDVYTKCFGGVKVPESDIKDYNNTINKAEKRILKRKNKK